MIGTRTAALDRVFAALSDATRRAMLRRLVAGERSVGDLAEPFDMSFAAAAKHVKVLEEAGLLKRRIAGRTHFCRIAAGPLSGVDRWLAYYQRFRARHLDGIERPLAGRRRRRR